MAENLGGISEDVSALIRAINAALPQSNTKKTVDIKVNGTKELKEAADSVKTFGAAVKTLDESGVDRVTKSVGSIMGLLSGKLKNAPVSSITTSLIEVFTKPDASAKQLLDTVLQVQSQLENVQRLSKKIDVSLLTSSQLDSLLSRQSKIDELQYEFSSNKGSEGRKDPRKYVLRREAYQKYEDIDVYQMARKAKRGKIQTAQEIAANIGIDPNTVTSADGEQLQTYIRTLDLLKQLIEARKEYGEIHTSTDANNYLKQEQQISKVYQEVLKQEAAIREKFKVKDDPLSASFKLDEQTVKQNAQQAAEAYVNWFMRTLQTQLNAALADLDTRVAQLQGNIEKRTEQSAQRVEKNTKFARGRGNVKAGGGSGSGTGGIGDGTGEAGSGRTESVGDTTAAGMEQVAEATEVAIDKIKQYLVTEEESIAKIKKLFKEIDDLYTKQVSATSDKEKNAIDLQIRDKLLEASKYRANLQRLGWPTDKEQMNEKLSKSVPEKLSSFAFDIDDAVRGSSQLLKENRQLIQSIRDYKYEVTTIPEAQSNGMSSAIDGIKEYLLSIEECINKIKELQDTKLDYSMDSEEYKGYVKEQALYFARLQKLGVSQDRIIDEIGIADYNELSDAVTKIQTGDFGDDIKVKYDAILSYVDSNPVTVKVETDEAKKKVDEIKKTINELAEQSKTVEFGAVFDSRTGRSSKTYSGKDKQIDLAEAYADAKKSGIQADTYFHTHPDAAKYAAFSLKDIETSIAAVKDGIRQSVLMVGDEVATMDVSSLAGLGQDFLKQFYASISTNVKNGLKQLRDNIAQSLSYGDVIDDLPMLTKQLQDDLKEVLEGEISEGRLSQQDADIIQPVINTAIDQVQQKLLEMIKSGEKLQGYTLINDSIQSIIDQVEGSIASSDIKIDPSVLNAIITDAFAGLDDVFDQEKFKKMFDKDNFPLDKMAQIQQKAISDALLQLGKEPEDFYKILTKDQYLGQVYDGENPKSKLHIDVSEAVNEINALKEVITSLREQIQQLSETKLNVNVDELEAKLERAQEEIDELNHALAGTVSESSNNFLSEQLSEAEQHIRELGEEVASLKQQLTDTQQKVQQTPLDMGALDKKVAELQYLHDKVRTIFDGKDGIINEDMTYDEKFNSAEVQRMIELLSQLTDAELKATMGIEGDEWVAEFRNNLQTEINLIRELQKEQQKVYDGTWPEDMEEPDLAIWRHLENIYDIVNNVTRQFESKLTPAVREFMSLLEGQVGADGMFSFLNGQNIDSYINDILSGAKTAKEAFADLENAFGWDTDRFASLIDDEVPEELKGLYDQLFSDVENRIKSAEQAAEEFNAKLKEIRDSAKSVKEETAPVGDQLKMTGYHATRSKWQTESFDFGKTKAAQLGSGMYMVDSPEKLSGFLSRPGGGDVKQTELNLQKCFILTEEYISSISDINKILGTTFDEATSAKEVMSAIRKYNNTSKENSDNFRKSMLEMGYQGMYVGDHLANKNIDSEVVIYDEKLLENLITIPKPDFKSIIDGATQASKAVITLRKDLQDLTEASTFSDQSSISQGTVQEQFQKISESTVNVVSDIGKTEDEIIAKLEEERAQAEAANEAWREHLILLDSSGKVVANHWGGEHNVSGFSKEQLESGQGGKIIHTHPGNASFFGAGDLKHLFEESLYSQIKEIELRYSDSILSVDTSSISKESSTTILEIMRNLRSKLTEMYTDNPGGVPSDDIRYQINAIEKEIFKSIADKLGVSVKETGQTSQDVVSALSDIDKQIIERFKSLSIEELKSIDYGKLLSNQTPPSSETAAVAEQEKAAGDAAAVAGEQGAVGFNQIEESAEGAAEAAVNVARTMDEIAEARARMDNGHNDFDRASIKRTLDGYYPGLGESNRAALYHLKDAHEAYDLSIENGWDWEKQYQWAIKFVSLFEQYRDNGGTEKSLSAHRELYEKLQPLVKGYREELQKVLDYESVTQGQTQSPQTQTNDASQQREQEHEAEVKSVEQLIAEYERLGSVLSTIEARHKGNIPIGEEKNRWDEASKAQKEVADKLRESGMYYSPDQGQWVEDVVNLEDKYKELLSLIESGDTKAISKMFSIDESELGDLEILKNNLKMVIDVLNATDGMSASSAKLSWWNGWLGGGRDLFNTDELTGALKTLGISDDIIEQVAQAHRDAAEAAKQHAAEEQAAADATKNVVDAAGAQKVPGKEQPSINPENTGETSDMSALGEAVNAVTKSVDDKTMAFSREAQVVQESVQIEIASLQQLVQQLETIRDLSQNLPKIQLTGKDGTKANPIISPELIKSIEQLKTAVGDFDPAKLTALFSSIKNLKINENVSTRMTELATGFTDLRNALDGWEGNAAKTLEMITQLVQKANALKDVIKTANEQNVKQPKADAQKVQKKEPEKPVEKSQDEIRADQLKAYNAALKEYDQLERERVRNSQQVNDLGAETLNKRIQLIKQMDDIQKQWNDSAAQGVAKTKEMLDAEQQRAIIEERTKVSESNKWNDQVKRSIGFSNLQNRVSKLKEEKDLRPDIFGERYEEIENKAKELSKMFPLKPFDEKAAEDARNVAEELGKMIAETRNAPEYKQAKDTFVSGLNRKIETWATNNQRAIKADPSGFEKIRQSLKEIDTLADGQNVSKMFDEFVAGANRAGNAGETFTQGLMKRFQSLGQYLLSFASFYRVIGVIKQAFNTVKQLDDALTEMRKVSDESLSSLKKYQSLSFDMADEVGTTSEQIQKSTADWLRLGESFEEAQKSAKESTILLNVSEFENIDSATQALVSASQAYKDLDKIDIIDKLNNIGNNFSISTDQLATGLQNAAAVLMTQGNDIDQALALLTAGNAITQDISKTSAGIRTISLRISGTEEAKDEIADMGEDIDDFVVRTKSKTDSIIRDYTAVASNAYKGVSVLDANGNLRSTYDILLDIAKVYEEIQAEDKENGTNRAQALVETLAGKNRSNIAASILQNPEMLEEVYESSKKSAGSAQQELDKYLDSITGKVAKLQNAIQELTFNALDSEPLKVIVDLLTSAVNLVNGLIKNFGSVNLVLGGLIGGLASKYGKGFLTFNKGTGIDIGSGIIKSIMQSSQQAKDILADELESNSYVPEMLISDMDTSVLDSYSGKLQQVFEDVKKVKGESAKMGDVMNAIKHPILGVGGALEKVGTLAAKFVTTVGNMAIYTLISVAASAVINTVVKAITWENELIKASEEAQNAITDMFDSFQKQTDSIKDIEVSLGFETNEDQSIDKTVSNIADKYSALHEGVNGVTNENINLTNDEYQQYLDTCNKIADQYPSLVKGWDSQGNAILNLGNSAKDARDAIMGMYEAQQLSANVQIGENLDTLYQGLSIKSGKIDKENKELAQQNEDLQKQILWDSVNSTLDMSGHKITASISEGNNQIIQEVIKNVMGRSDAYDELVKNGSQYQLDNTIVYDLDQIQGMTDEKIAQIEESLSRLQVSPGEMSIVASNTEQALANELKKADLWASMRGAISQYLQTSKSFQGINDEIQTAILGNLSDLDLTKLDNGSYENAVDFIYGEILAPMSQLNEKTQTKLAEAFNLDTSKINQQDYYSKIKAIFSDIFGAEDADKWMDMLGFNSIFDEIVYDTSAIFDTFSDNLTDAEIAQIKELSVDQIRTANQLIGKKSYKGLSFKHLMKDILEENVPKYDDTLSDLFGDENYQKMAEQYESNISSVTEALETLRTQGQLTAEEMAKLQEAFPDFFKSTDDFSLEHISDIGAKQFSEWVERIKSSMKTMTPEMQEAAQMYINNLANSFDFDISEEAMKEAAYSRVKSLGQGTYISEVLNNLQQKYGGNLDREIVFRLALNDELSGPMDEIYRKYDELYSDKRFDGISEKIKNLGRNLTNLQAEGQEMQDVISLRETKGIKTTVKNYNRLLKNNKEQVKNLKVQNDLLKMQQSYVGKESDKWYEIKDQIDSNNSSIRDLISSQYEYGKNISMSAVTNTQNLLSQLQNASSKGHMDSSSLQELISMARGNAEDILTTTTTGSYADPQAIRELYEQYSELGLSIVNTQMAAEQLDFSNNEKEMLRLGKRLDPTIEDINDLHRAMAQNPDNPDYAKIFDLDEENQGILQTITNLQSLEEEILANSSALGQYQAALSSANWSDPMQTIRGGMESADKLYDQGWWGKDDFTSYAQLIATNEQLQDKTGWAAIEAYEENREAVKRYLTEDATGVDNWVDDMVSKSKELGEEWATLDEQGNYTFNVQDMEKFATAMGRSTEFAEYMLMAMKDANYDIDISRIDDEFSRTFNNISGTEANAAQQVKNLVTEMQNVALAGGDISQGAEAAGSALMRMREAGVSDDVINSLVEELNLLGEFNGFHIDPKTLEVTTTVDTDEIDEVDANLSRPRKLMFDYGVNLGSVREAHNAIMKQWQGNEQNIRYATKALQDYTAEQLLAIDHNDGAWSEGEKEIESFAETLGLPLDQVNALIIALEQMGMLKPQVEAEVDTSDAESGVETLREKLAKPFKAIVEVATENESIQNIKDKIKEKFQAGIENVKLELQQKEAEKQYSSIVDATKEIPDAVSDASSNITSAISNGASSVVSAINGGGNNGPGGTNGTTTYSSTTTGQSQHTGASSNASRTANNGKGSSNNNGKSSGGSSAGAPIQSRPIDYSVLPSQQVVDVSYVPNVQQVENTNEEIEKKPVEQEVELVNKGKGSPFVGDQTTTLTTKTDTSGALSSLKEVASAAAGLGGKTIQFNGDSSKLVAEADKGAAAINRIPNSHNTNITATDNASGTAQRIKDAIAGIKSKVVSIVAKVSGESGVSTLASKIAGLASKTVNVVSNFVTNTIHNKLGFGGGTAYSSGTTLGHGYANGTAQDWTVGKDEDALTNEVGQESIVRDGKWMLLPGGPHVEKLKKDDIVFNAEQTEDLLETGKTARRGKIIGGAYANGTASDGIDAFYRRSSNAHGNGNINKTRRGKTKSTKTTSGNGGNGGNSGKGSGNGNGKSSNKNNNKSPLDQFKEWLEKLFDWIEVRVQRLEYDIDLYQAKSENRIGYLAKNAEINSAFKTTQTLISDAEAGAARYLKQAEAVRKKAVSLGVVTQEKSEELVNLIKSGKIDINEYDDKTKEFITSYKDWYDKGKDLTAQVEDLKTQLKELEQTKLDNITKQFESLASWSDAVSARAQAMGEFLTSAGKTVNSADIKSTFGTQIFETSLMIGRYQDELKAFADELVVARSVFGENSNEYHEAMAQYEEINKSLIEASTQYNELNKQLYELDLTKLEYAMDKLEQFGDKLASIVSLKETRGTLFGATSADIIGESDYSQQIRANNDIIKIMAEDRQKRINEIAQFGWDVDSDNYKEAYDAIMNDEKEILNLLESNEKLKESIRTLRWKPFEELQKQIEEATGDYDHLRDLITDNQKFDSEDGIYMTARGYADLALLAQQIGITQGKIADYRKALDKLQSEYKNGNISLETLNESSRDYINTIQSSVTAVDGYKDAIIELYKTQITNENSALQDTIDLRKKALSAKKAYYDYDKNLSEKSKDVSMLKAQIQALQGVTNDAAKAQRAKLQAQLAEAEEELKDTIRQHQYEATSQGYDQLSEDSQEALDNTIKQLEANADQQDQIVNMMLDRLKTHYSDAYTSIQDIISSTGTVIGDVANSSINQLETTADKIISLAKAMEVFQTQASATANNINTSTIITADSAVKAVENTIKANNTDATIANAKASTQISGKAATPNVVSAPTAVDNAAANQTKSSSNTGNSTPTTPATPTAQTNTRNQAEYDAIMAAINLGKKRSSVSAAEQKKHLPIWNYITTKYKHELQYKVYSALAKAMNKFWGTKFNTNGKKLTNANKAKMLELLKAHGYKAGSKRIPIDEMAWTNENWKKDGSELIISKRDGAILTPLKAGDSVIPADLADNLFKWGAINPSMLQDKFVSKLPNFSSMSTNMQTPVTIESIITVNGNVDESVMPQLEELGKQLANNLNFQRDMTKVISHNLYKDAKKQGYRK